MIVLAVLAAVVLVAMATVGGVIWLAGPHVGEPRHRLDDDLRTRQLRANRWLG